MCPECTAPQARSAGPQAVRPPGGRGAPDGRQLLCDARTSFSFPSVRAVQPQPLSAIHYQLGQQCTRADGEIMARNSQASSLFNTGCGRALAVPDIG